LGTPGRTIRDYDESLKEIKKENFNLKLRIFFLEERLVIGRENSNDKLIASNIDLKVQLEGCRQDLSEKLSLLVEASEALEHLDAQMKTENEQHKQEVDTLKEKCQDLKACTSNHNICKESKQEKSRAPQIWQSYPRTNSLTFEADDSENNNTKFFSNETMVLEVLEELEEFSEKEKDFEHKYNKNIHELKMSSAKTEMDLQKIKLKMSECEDEIESLNSNLDAKNDFIAALQQNIDEKNKEFQCLVMQLEKTSEVTKIQEGEIDSIKIRLNNEINKSKGTGRIMKTQEMNTERNNFTDIIQLLEDEILFKNQEIHEFQSEIRIRDARIYNFEETLKSLKSNYEDSEMPEENAQDRYQSLKNENQKLGGQLKLHIHERKLLLKKISMLKDQLESNGQQIENRKVKKDDSDDDAAYESKETGVQCNLEQSAVMINAYKHNLSRHRSKMQDLKKKLADSIESLQVLRKNHDKFVHLVEVIVNMDDINMVDEINNLVNDTKKLEKIQYANEEVQLEDLDLCYSLPSSNCSLNTESHEILKSAQTGIMQHLEEETKEQNKNIIKNNSMIFAMEDELLMRDALTDGQIEIIKCLKNYCLKMDGNMEAYKEQHIEYNFISNSRTTQEPSTCCQASENDSYSLCSSNACIAEENIFLSNLLDTFREEMDTCQSIDSGCESDYDKHEDKEDTTVLKFCRKCSPCIEKDIYEVLKKLHYGLPEILEQVRKFKFRFEKLYKNNKKAFSDVKRIKETLNDYHVLITKLTSENLKMTEEKLISNSEIEKTHKESSKIINELEDEICSLNSQLADKEVEALKTKTRLMSPRTTYQECFYGRNKTEEIASESPLSSDSYECVQLITELSTSHKQKPFYSPQRPSTRPINYLLSHSKQRNEVEETSNSEDDENSKGRCNF